MNPSLQDASDVRLERRSLLNGVAFVAIGTWGDCLPLFSCAVRTALQFNAPSQGRRVPVLFCSHFCWVEQLLYEAATNGVSVEGVPLWPCLLPPSGASERDPGKRRVGQADSPRASEGGGRAEAGWLETQGEEGVARHPLFRIETLDLWLLGLPSPPVHGSAWHALEAAVLVPLLRGEAQIVRGRLCAFCVGCARKRTALACAAAKFFKALGAKKGASSPRRQTAEEMHCACQDSAPRATLQVAVVGLSLFACVYWHATASCTKRLMLVPSPYERRAPAGFLLQLREEFPGIRKRRRPAVGRGGEQKAERPPLRCERDCRRGPFGGGK